MKMTTKLFILMPLRAGISKNGASASPFSFWGAALSGGFIIFDVNLSRGSV